MWWRWLKRDPKNDTAFRKHRIARLIEGAIEDFAPTPQGYKPQSNRSA